MPEWIDDALYRQLCDELLQDPLPSAPAHAEPTPLPHGDPSSVWFTPAVPPRLDGWCEDRNPQAGLSDADGHE